MKTKAQSVINLLCLFALTFIAQADPAKEVIGSLKGTLIYATNAPEEHENAKPLSDSLKQNLIDNKLPFSSYYLLGSDQQDIYKGYQNWLKPISNSEKLMLSFEPKQSAQNGNDIEIAFWQDKKKVFCTKTLSLDASEPLIITGPKWRNGKVIIILTLK